MIGDGYLVVTVGFVADIVHHTSRSDHRVVPVKCSEPPARGPGRATHLEAIRLGCSLYGDFRLAHTLGETESVSRSMGVLIVVEVDIDVP